MIIETKYKGATNTKGARIIASSVEKTVTVPYNHAWSIEGNHEMAAKELAEQTERHGKWVGGWLKDRAMVWVRDELTARRFKA